MSSQFSKPFVDHLAWIVPSIVPIVLWIVDHWSLAGSGVLAISTYISVLLAGYSAFRLVRFSRRFYQRVKRSEVKNNLESKKLAVELKTLRDAVGTEFTKRLDLERQVLELEKRLSVLSKQKLTQAELLMPSVIAATTGKGR